MRQTDDVVRTELLVEPAGSTNAYVGELWRLREVCWILAWRDIAIRYKQTVVGIGWVVIQPLLSVLILTVVFGRLAHLPAGRIPYPLLVLSGMLPWQFVSQAVSSASNSLVANSTLVSKVYIPRMLIPLATILSSGLDLAVGMTLLVLLLIGFRTVPAGTAVFVPLLVLPLGVIASGVGLLLSAVNVKYRDVRYVIPFALQLGLYVTPVGFRSDIVPESWRIWLYLNPVAGVIDLWRWLLFADGPLYARGVFVSLFATGVLLWLGIRQFRSAERSFADVI